MPPNAVFFACAGALLCTQFKVDIKKTFCIMTITGAVQWLLFPNARPLPAFAFGLTAPLITQCTIITLEVIYAVSS